MAKPHAHHLPETASSSIANALEAAARRWNEWADELACAEVAASFRKQAEEAERYARIVRNSDVIVFDAVS